MARRRMYLFESAYVVFAARIRRFVSRLWETCSSVWSWFWEGPGARAFEVFLRVLVLAGAAAACWFYVRYEAQHGRGFSAGSLGACAVIFVFAFLVLWGWKAPVHLAGRIGAGGSAAGLILCISVASTAVAIVVFTAYFLVLLTMTAASVVVFLPMRAGQELSLLYRKISYQCPYDDCSYRGLPIHLCPTCGTQYDDLLPSFYGIFHHSCRHGSSQTKLPTMDFLGRSKLDRLCGRCKRPLVLSSIGELSERPIAVVGGPSAGKTIFLRQAVRVLRERFAVLPGARVSIDSKDQERILAADLALLDHGQRVAKTAGDVVQAFGLAIRIPKRFSALLYLYDAAGEHFISMQRFGRWQAVEHMAGIVLLVDPFALPVLAEHAQLIGAEVGASQSPLSQVVSTLINGINALFPDASVKCKIPLAVVIAKCDALPVQQMPFLADLCPGPGRPADDALSARCREALVKLGEQGRLHSLEQRFAEVRYFGCSALGRLPDLRNTAAFQPAGVVEPFFWLLKIDAATAKKKGK